MKMTYLEELKKAEELEDWLSFDHSKISEAAGLLVDLVSYPDEVSDEFRVLLMVEIDRIINDYNENYIIETKTETTTRTYREMVDR